MQECHCEERSNRRVFGLLRCLLGQVIYMSIYLEDNKFICKVPEYFIKEDEGIEPLQLLPVPLFSRQVADH